MNTLLQNIIVYAIVAIAIVASLLGLWRIVRPRKKGDAPSSPCCGCKGCSVSPRKKKE
ncbi:FeoB-associated Cys-rich membrane protein [Porphyromonas gingivicanis]|uniref:FeoB-associated Cys-rich membrane protein n=1 Tax=Porphyromonas gingivicanis TaxID=266762 RepID=UPI0009DD8251|nr:FeoB-associated Cys-rich membrane protein [Porphyromonas gingivicanis]